MKKAIVSILLFLSTSIPAIADNGLINVQSAYTVKETADRLENVLNKKGMTIFKRINHSDGAAKVGIDLRETVLVIFGNPKVGAPLMMCQQSVAIDLPQKALIWKDAKGSVWISYNDPEYLKNRHGIAGCEKVLQKVANALAGMTKAASAE